MRVLGLAVAVVLSTAASVEAEQVCIKYHKCVRWINSNARRLHRAVS